MLFFNMLQFHFNNRDVISRLWPDAADNVKPERKQYKRSKYPIYMNN